jgi:ketosteroid isomerase-like protein
VRGTLLVALAAAITLSAPQAVATGAARQNAANKETAQRFLRAIRRRDALEMRSVLAPSAHLTLMIAGVYSPELHAFAQGRQWPRDMLIQKEMDFQKGLQGALVLRTMSLIAEDNLVAAEVVGHGIRAATGRPYVQHYSYHFQMSHGQIAEIRLYLDTLHLWDIWENTGPPAKPPYSIPNPTTAPDEPVKAEEHSDPFPEDIRTDEGAVNKECVRRYLMSVQTHDAERERATWAADGVWSFAVGGDYSPELHAFLGAPRWGREAMITMHIKERNLREPLTFDIYSLIAEGDAVSIEAVGFMVRADGRAYRQHYSIHFKARNGKLVEGHVYQDTLHQYDLTLDHAPYTPVAVAPPKLPRSEPMNSGSRNTANQ